MLKSGVNDDTIAKTINFVYAMARGIMKWRRTDGKNSRLSSRRKEVPKDTAPLLKAPPRTPWHNFGCWCSIG